MIQDAISQENIEISVNAAPKPVHKRHKRIKPTGLSWFDDAHSSVKGETALWVAVITQAMMDALSKSENPEMRYHKNEAIHWLTSNSKDFIEVCFHAGLDPDYVRRRAKKTLVSPVAWRAAPGEGKRYLERKQKRNKPDAEVTTDDMSAPCQIIAGPWVTKKTKSQ